MLFLIKKMKNITKNDWKKIIQNELGMISTLKYGSSLKKQKEAKDIDLFIIYQKRPHQKTATYENKIIFDINQTSLQELQQKLQLRDIDFTEPILTGKTIKGNKEIEKEAKDYLHNNKPCKVAIDYIKKRSIESLIQTEQLIVKTKYDILLEKVQNESSIQEIKKAVLKNQESNISQPSFNVAINQLNYALSYHASAKRYEENSKIVLFSDLINSPKNKAEELLIETRNYQKNNTTKNLGDLINYYENAKKIIKRW